MAIVYCYSGAVGAANGTSWTDAYTTLAAAISGATAGTDQIYLAKDHSESAASYTFSLTASNPPYELFSIDRVDDSYAIATGDQVTASAGNITFDGGIIGFGVQLNASADILLNSDANEYQLWHDPYFKPGNDSQVYANVPGNIKIFDPTIDCTNDTGASTSGIFGTGSLSNCHWSNIIFLNVTNRSRAFYVTGQGSGNHVIEGTDLSVFDYLIDANAAQPSLDVLFQGCILKSGYTISDSTANTRSWAARTIGCSVSGTNKKYLLDTTIPALGAVATEETIVRTGGATDPDSQLISWVATTTANTSKYAPFLLPHEIVGWLNSTGSKTFKIHMAHTNAGSGTGNALMNDEIWFELIYLKNAGDIQTGIASTRWDIDDPTATPADYSTNSETWGGAPDDKQEMSLTVTVNQTGPYKIRIYAGKTSMGSVYIDPKVIIS